MLPSARYARAALALLALAPLAALPSQRAEAIAPRQVAAPNPPPLAPQSPATAIEAAVAAAHPGATALHRGFYWADDVYSALATYRGGDYLLSYASRARRGLAPMSLMEPVARLERLDLDADGRDELLTWSPSDVLHVFSLRAGDVVEVRRRALLLRGARDVAEVRARLPLLRGYNAPAPGVSPMQVVLSLQHATNEQLRALIAPQGLRTCTVNTGNIRPRSRRCREHRGAALTPALLARELLQVATFEEYQGQPAGQREGVEVHWLSGDPECNRNTCFANMGGPGEYVWVFTGDGASLRLREFSQAYTEDS